MPIPDSVLPKTDDSKPITEGDINNVIAIQKRLACGSAGLRDTRQKIQRLYCLQQSPLHIRMGETADALARNWKLVAKTCEGVFKKNNQRIESGARHSIGFVFDGRKVVAMKQNRVTGFLNAKERKIPFL